MAFPQVESLSAQVFSSSTSHEVNMPETVNDGDLLLVHFTYRETTTGENNVATPDDWRALNEFTPSLTNVRLRAFAKRATGSEGGTLVDFVTDAPRKAVAHIRRITNWFGDIDEGVSVEFLPSPGALQNFIDCPALTASWGVADNLWVVAASAWAVDIQEVLSYPANYVSGTFEVTGGGVSDVLQGTAHRENTVIIEDPGTFVFDDEQASLRAITIAIRPTGPAENECENHEPTTQSVRDEFAGPNNTPLSSHTSDSGHAWIEGHGNPPLSTRRRGFGSISGPQLYPMVLNGQGSLVNPQAWRLRDSRQLVYAPRTNSYEIGACFQRQDLAMPDNSLSFFWRDTSTEYFDGSGKRYELFLLKGGDMVLRKRIGNTITVLDADTAVFADGANNYLQIIQDGSDISIKLNGVEVLSATDAAITEVGTISLNINGRSLLSPYPKGFWRLNWFYVDDSYASFPVANKAVVLSEQMKALESLVKEEPDFETTHFVNVTDTLTAVDFTEPPSIEEPTTKDVEIFEGLSFGDNINLTQDSECWFHDDWGYRKKITIDHTKVSGSASLTEFIIPLVLIDSDIQAQAQADGDDILFTAADGLTQLDHELVAYNNATGRVEAWIKIPSLSNTVDTEIWVYFGNGGASAQEDPANVWTGYHHVHHCNEDPGGGAPQVTDSSGNGRHGTTEGSMTSGDLVTGQVGLGYDLDGINDAWACAGVSPAAGNFTRSIWARRNTFPNTSAVNVEIMHQADGSGTGRDYASFIQTSGTSNPNITYKLNSFLGAAQTVGARTFNTADNGVWFKITVTYDGTTLRLYVDGVQDAAVARTMEATTGNLLFGKSKGNTLYFPGILDEAYFYNGLRSADWLRTEYNFEVDPDGYYTVGNLQDPSACLTEFISILDAFIAHDNPELSGDKGIELLEIAHIRELPGVSGNHVNKVLTIADFVNAGDGVSPSREIAITDSFTASEIVGRVFDFLDLLSAQETQSIEALIQVADTASLEDALALRIIIALADSMTLTDVLSRYADIRDTASMADLIEFLRTTSPQADFARARDSVTIVKSGAAEFAPPERTFYARDLKRLKIVEKGKHVIR